MTLDWSQRSAGSSPIFRLCLQGSRKILLSGMLRFTFHFYLNLKRPIFRTTTFNFNDYPDHAATYTALCERVSMLPFLCIDMQVAQLRNAAEEAQTLIGELLTFTYYATNQREIDDLTKRAKTARMPETLSNSVHTQNGLPNLLAPAKVLYDLF